MKPEPAAGSKMFLYQTRASKPTDSTEAKKVSKTGVGGDESRATSTMDFGTGRNTKLQTH